MEKVTKVGMTAAELKEMLTVHRAPRKTTLPVLKNVHLSHGKIIVDDLENRVEIDTGTEFNFNCLVDYIQFLKIVSSLPAAEQITFSLNPTEGVLVIGAEEGAFKINALSEVDEVDNYPTITDARWEKVDGYISDENLAAIMTAVRFTAKDDLRPAMSGVHFSKEHNEIQATDAHRLYWKELGDTFTIPENFIVTKSTVNILPKLCKKGKLQLCDLDVELGYYRDVPNSRAYIIRFTRGGRSVISRLVYGKYPNIHAVIPKDNPISVVIDRADALSKVKRALIAANETTKRVELTLTATKAKLAGRDPDINSSYSTEVATQMPPTVIDGDFLIGFNGVFFTEIVSTMEGEAVQLEMSQSNRALIITGFKAKGKYLLMPVMTTD